GAQEFVGEAVLLKQAGRAEGMIGGCRHRHGAGAVGAREARRLAKPDQLGNRLHLLFHEHTGRALASFSIVSTSTGETVSRVMPARLRASVLAQETSGKV